MSKAKETRLIDYSESRPPVGGIVKSGYVGAIRYLSHTPSKNLDKAEAKALHDAGRVIGLVWETTATRAGEGKAAGNADRLEAEKQAKALGYPKGCPIFYAVDFDAVPATILPYFAGVFSRATYLSGPYGSATVVQAVKAAHPEAVCWQTEAWSGGVVSAHARLFQRVGHKAPSVPGGGYDENVVLAPLPLWGKGGVVTVAPPAKKVKPRGLPLRVRAAEILSRRWFDRFVRTGKRPLSATADARLTRHEHSSAAARKAHR